MSEFSRANLIESAPRLVIPDYSQCRSFSLLVEAAHDVSSEKRDHGKFATGGSGSEKSGNPPKPTAKPGSKSEGMVALEHRPTGKTVKNKQGEIKPQMEHRLPGGGELPEHLKSIPRAWTDVKASLDPNSDLHATGKDEKGRSQSKYSPEHDRLAGIKKFSKVRKLLDQHQQLGELHHANSSHADHKTAEGGKVMTLIHSMGLRPGSEKDTGAEKQAYGATTLQGRHVVTEGGKTHLQFVGKKGVNIKLAVTDPKAEKILLDAKKKNGDGKLFDISAGELRDYAHQHGGFNPKDYRTAKGTKVARDEAAKLQSPNSSKEKEAHIKAVAKTVSEHLGNTPQIARKDYIDPSTFEHWKNA